MLIGEIIKGTCQGIIGPDHIPGHYSKRCGKIAWVGVRRKPKVKRFYSYIEPPDPAILQKAKELGITS